MLICTVLFFSPDMSSYKKYLPPDVFHCISWLCPFFATWLLPEAVVRMLSAPPTISLNGHFLIWRLLHAHVGVWLRDGQGREDVI